MSSNLYLHQEDCSFSYSARDINDNPLPQAIYQEFQDLAGRNAEELGVGYQDLKAKDLIWVVVKESYKVLSPLPFEPLKAYTWPHPKKMLEFNRDYKITDLAGRPLIIGTSQWCVVNIKTRKLTLGNIKYKDGQYHDETTFPEGFYLLKPKDLTNLLPALTHTVVFTELDHNRHMNNTYYASLIIDAIKDMCDYQVEQMQINFLKESNIGDILKIYVLPYSNKENEYQVIGINQKGETSFNSYLLLKHI